MELKFGNYIIRSWAMEDAQTFAKYGNNRNIWRNLRDAFPYPYTLHDAKQFITKALTNQPETLFCISSRVEAIGSIGLALGQDVHRYTAELGEVTKNNLPILLAFWPVFFVAAIGEYPDMHLMPRLEYEPKFGAIMGRLFFVTSLGYWLAEPYWNLGIISEAVRIFSAYSFERFKLIRIHAEPYAINPASSRVLEKAGFRYEGRLKASVYKDGNVLDQLIYAKTKLT